MQDTKLKLEFTVEPCPEPVDVTPWAGLAAGPPSSAQPVGADHRVGAPGGQVGGGFGPETSCRAMPRRRLGVPMPASAHRFAFPAALLKTTPPRNFR